MRIGDYEVQGELARGAYGVVYRAHDAALRRDVAIKLLIKTDRTRSHELRRFTREARALARLHHPNIVTVLGSGRKGDHPYLVMKLVEGETLEARLERDDHLPPAEAVGIAIKLARAIDHAHQVLILHRDIKPANVILAPSGEPLLTDFGLAKDLAPSNSDSISVDGRFMGTPGYWPPEQALGEVHRIGAPSDIYALGATLYACLTGRPPHPQGSLPEALVAMERRAPIEAPSVIRPGVAPSLDRIVLGCLEHEPGDRYLSALDLADDLERWLRGEAPRGPGANSRSAVRRVGLSPVAAKSWVPALAFAALSMTVIGAAVAVALSRPVATRDVGAGATPTASPTEDPRVVAARREAEARGRLEDLTEETREPKAYDIALASRITTAIETYPEAAAKLRRLLRRYQIRRARYAEIEEQVPDTGDPGPYRDESLWIRAKALDGLERASCKPLLQRLAATPSAGVYRKLAQMMLAMKKRRWTEAKPLATEALERDPGVDALAYLMVLRLKRNQGEAALRLGKRGLLIASDDFFLQFQIARAYMSLLRADRVLQHLDLACRLSGPRPPAEMQVWRVKTLYNLKRFEEAIAACDTLTRDHPDHTVDADVMAGVIHLADRERDRAEARWRRAHRRDPKRFRRAVRYHPPPNLRNAILKLVGERPR